MDEPAVLIAIRERVALFDQISAGSTTSVFFTADQLRELLAWVDGLGERAK